MDGLQAWFAPLLWIIGTITALGGFVRFCKPIWKIVQAPKELAEEMQGFRAEMTNHFNQVNLRLDQYDKDLQHLKERAASADSIQISLLRDHISTAYHFALDKGEISESSYRTVCDMYASYKKDGGNSYIDAIMEQVHELYKDTQEAKRARGAAV